MHRSTKDSLRAPVSQWVTDRDPTAVEVAPHSGQRFVFRTSNQTALKLWPPDNDKELERCRREVATLRDGIRGFPRVLSDIDEVQIAGRLFIYYEEEWLQARSLLEIVQKEGSDRDLAMRALFQGAAVLQELHSRNIVHRDISPNNILRSSATNEIFLIDLGLAKHLDLEPLTAPDEQLPMTKPFASIEQLTAGSFYLDEPTDIYSLALTVSYIGSGTHPFLPPAGSVEPQEYIARLSNRDYVNPDAIFDPIIHRMLNPLAVLRPRAETVSASEGG